MSAPPGFDPTSSVLPQPGGSLPQIHVQSGGGDDTKSSNLTRVPSTITTIQSTNLPIVPPVNRNNTISF